MAELQPETLSSKETYSKDELKIEELKIEELQVPDYDYGQSQNTLDYNIAIRNKPTGGGLVYCGTGSRTTTEGTGTQAITGVGFKPKMILIQAVYASGEGSYSNGQAMSTSDEFTIYQQNQSGGSYTLMTYVAGRIIFVRNYTGTLTSRADISSIDTDGFTLNWAEVGIDVNFMFQCFG